MPKPLTCLCLVALTLSVPAQACDPALPPTEEMIEEIASGGLMISGAIIRSVDAKSKQPEVIEAVARHLS